MGLAMRRSTFGVSSTGMKVSDARKLRSLEDKNKRLKKLLAEAMLENAAIKDVLGKQW